MTLDNSLHNRQTKPTLALISMPAFIDPMKMIKDVGYLSLRDSLAIIAHGEADRPFSFSTHPLVDFRA